MKWLGEVFCWWDFAVGYASAAGVIVEQIKGRKSVCSPVNVLGWLRCSLPRFSLLSRLVVGLCNYKRLSQLCNAVGPFWNAWRVKLNGAQWLENGDQSMPNFAWTFHVMPTATTPKTKTIAPVSWIPSPLSWFLPIGAHYRENAKRSDKFSDVYNAIPLFLFEEEKAYREHYP